MQIDYMQLWDIKTMIILCTEKSIIHIYSTNIGTDNEKKYQSQ